MALTVADANSRSQDVWGRQLVRIVDVTFDASYPAGGESFVASDVGLSEIIAVIPCNVTAGYLVNYDATAETLEVYGVQQDADAAVTEPFDEEDDTADLSAVSVRLVVIGI